ncbi:DUF4254 domain-containing protein [Nocardia iowensis]|uniref:DUF4254 domain-containing protein n=1 Tax=Nocardia iowensis TaxID=204891 RepID=A0ABX8S2B8_NOCIO|nr:DUF4254 domain-containing protein [Nocardia iowensis]
MRNLLLATKAELIVALCGSFSGDGSCGPLCREAHSLVQLHRRRRSQPLSCSEIDGRRAEIVACIDEWVTRAAPCRNGSARLHPESVGMLIDRMAAAAARVLDALERDGPAGTETHAAWVRLAELEIQYGDLVAEVTDGRRRLV